MAVNLRGVTVVLLPGTGSDDDYVYRAFSRRPARRRAPSVVTPAPEPDRLVEGYRRRRWTTRRGSGPIAVGGVSIGAAVAAVVGAGQPDRARSAVLAALPAWTGSPETAPAALAAQLLGRACCAATGWRRRSPRCAPPARRGWPTS